jgi:hypothetical protein
MHGDAVEGVVRIADVAIDRVFRREPAGLQAGEEPVSEPEGRGDPAIEPGGMFAREAGHAGEGNGDGRSV